ncbi:thyrotropin subunit beta [Rana temporaria]|uniref:thyrotropin subunit beta n=1 Tax=Rana temporaria TaxID=8407 RepID=UPI001AADBC40|nr:thyrotropin subunit beta [Rana temporaria]
MLVKLFQLHFCLIPRMTSIFMVSFLLCFAHGHAAFLCMLTEYTMYVEMEECSHCIAINTTICSGYCSTKDPNMKGNLPEAKLNQKICTYSDYILKTVSIPGCPVHVNPHYTYPVALSCSCDRCNTGYIDCVQDSIESNYCTKPRKPKDFFYNYAKKFIGHKFK